MQRVEGRKEVSFDGHTALANATRLDGSQEREVGLVVTEIKRDQEVRNELFLILVLVVLYVRAATLCKHGLRLMCRLQPELITRRAMPSQTRLISTHHNIESSSTSERRSVVPLAAVHS